jgi:hypothetical protein
MGCDMNATSRSKALGEALARAEGHSPFLRNLIARRPEIVAALIGDGVEAALAAGRAVSAPEARRRSFQPVAIYSCPPDFTREACPSFRR